MAEGINLWEINPLYMLGAGAAAGVLLGFIVRLFKRKCLPAESNCGQPEP